MPFVDMPVNEWRRHIKVFSELSNRQHHRLVNGNCMVAHCRDSVWLPAIPDITDIAGFQESKNDAQTNRRRLRYR